MAQKTSIKMAPFVVRCFLNSNWAIEGSIRISQIARTEYPHEGVRSEDFFCISLYDFHLAFP
jgi:hypothetical protein